MYKTCKNTYKLCILNCICLLQKLKLSKDFAFKAFYCKTTASSLKIPPTFGLRLANLAE